MCSTRRGVSEYSKLCSILESIVELTWGPDLKGKWLLNETTNEVWEVIRWLQWGLLHPCSVCTILKKLRGPT